VTPQFSLRQDDGFVYVVIRVPFVRVSDLEYVVDGASLSFFCKPYLLQLELPGRVVDDDRTKAVYDPNTANGTVTLHLPKEQEGENFPDLDLLTQLRRPKKAGQVRLTLDEERAALDEMYLGTSALAPKDVAVPPPVETASLSASPLVQVLSSETFDDQAKESTTAEEQECLAAKQKADEGQEKASTTPSPEVNKLASVLERTGLMEATSSKAASPSMEILAKNDAMKQAALLEPADRLLVGAPKYGFNKSYSNFFADLLNEFPELVDLPNPDDTSEAMRKPLREEAEDEAFSEERFVSDTLGGEEDPIYQEASHFTPFWQAPVPPEGEYFTTEEKEQMVQLQNRELLEMSPQEVQEMLCCVFDLIIAFSYDCRTTGGDATVESAWTIRILSSTLSWLDHSTTPQEVVKASMHRLLAYPYMRRLDMAEGAIKDAATIISRGKRDVVRCILAIHRILTRSEQYYLLNRLYLNDLCIWVQQLDSNVLVQFAAQVRDAVNCTKSSLRWDLDRIVSRFLRRQDGQPSSDSESGSDETTSDDSSEESSEEEMNTNASSGPSISVVASETFQTDASVESKES